jgi:hypothetical protein
MSNSVPNTGVQFDRVSAEKIAAVVRAITQQQGRRDPHSPVKPIDVGGFYAQITGISGSGHSWKRMDMVNGVLTVSSPLVQDTNYSATDINSQIANVGANVFMRLSGYDTSTPPKPTYSFVAPLPVPQYQWMVLGAISQNQRGAFFTPAVSMI